MQLGLIKTNSGDTELVNSKSDVVYLISKYISADLTTEVEEYFDNKDIEEDIYYRFLDDLEIEFETLQDKFRALRGEY